MTDYVSQAKALVKSNDYLMISKTWCPDCVYTYKIWEKYNVKSKFHIVELDLWEDQNEATKLEEGITEIAGRKWVPTIFLKGDRYDEQDLKKWESEGKTEEVFKKYGLL